MSKNILFTNSLQINDLVILKRSSAARMDVASRNSGCVTLTMTVAMTQMSQRTCVVRRTAPPDGRDAQDSPTIAAFPNGCSAMAKMTVGITVMNSRRIVQLASLRRTSSAAITDAFQSEFVFFPHGFLMGGLSHGIIVFQAVDVRFCRRLWRWK